MRILHFIPEITGNRDVRKEFFRHLTKMSASIEMRVLTTDGDTGLENAEKISRIIPIMGKKVAGVIEEFHPEIIHIHGCTGHSELKVLRTAIKYHIPAVVSPSGSLAAITLSERSAVRQLTSDASRARKIIASADAVHVTGDIEMETVRKLQIIPGKDTSKDLGRKTTLIKNSVLTNAVTDEEMRNSFIQLYRKVIYSRAYDVMLPETKEMEKILLRTGVCTDYVSEEETFHNIAGNVSNEEMEKIFIHAETEHVRDFIVKGCQVSGITYIPDSSKCREKAGLSGEDTFVPLSAHIEKIKSKNNKIIRDFENYEKESELYCIIVAAQQMMHKGRLSYRHITEIADLLVHTDYREDIALKLFKDSKIYEFAARLMQITHEYAGLPEGFMPVAPVNDNKTKDLITFLTLKSR